MVKLLRKKPKSRKKKRYITYRVITIKMTTAFT